jgi:hypothetical protein
VHVRWVLKLEGEGEECTERISAVLVMQIEHRPLRLREIRFGAEARELARGVERTFPFVMPYDLAWLKPILDP